jgi:hypothetical protein
MNGSLDKMSEILARQGTTFGAELTVLTLAVQRLADLGDSREKTVKETAAALKVADDQRRDASDTRARPITQTTLIVGAVVGVLGLVLTAYLATR